MESQFSFEIKESYLLKQLHLTEGGEMYVTGDFTSAEEWLLNRQI